MTSIAFLGMASGGEVRSHAALNHRRGGLMIRKQENTAASVHAVKVDRSALEDAAVAQEGLLPKEWTGAAEFLRDHPQIDGKGIVIGVLDTGIDPAAPGLLKTTDGKTKVIDIVDCTGSGDVDTSTVVTEKDGCIVGLSGRELTLGDGIKALNSSGSYHVGLKSAFEFFPRQLVARLRRERKRKWDLQQRQCMAEVQVKLAHVRNEASTDSTSDNVKNRLEKEDCEAMAAQLRAIERDYKDPGPIWRAVIDTKETGDLSSYPVLENYRVRHRCARVCDDDLLHFGVNIYDKGNVLSIVVDAGYHGTHVAGTIAANFPDNPQVNGLAPGAQIVSLKIGDSRLGSMETHQGLIRAMTYLTPSEEKESKGAADDEERHKIRCDLLNMSYGEKTFMPNSGRFIKLATELVEKHNIMFISSAGNEGPGMSTLTAPGGTSTALIAVGAYVTPEMATQAYSYIDEDFFHARMEQEEPVDSGDTVEEASEADIDDDDEPMPVDYQTFSIVPSTPKKEEIGAKTPAFQGVPGVPYTWCSRGPATNGALGMNICAPGGAIAPVPVWTLRKKMLLNGTSMASPSAAGAVALLMSFVKQKGLKHSPIRMQRALENTAKPLVLRNLGPDGDLLESADPFGTGNGSIHVPSAADYLIEATRHDSMTAEGKAAMSKMELHIVMLSTQSWVKVPKRVVLMGLGRSFPIVVDPSGLKAGQEHFAEITGYIMAGNVPSGPLFRFPVTVTKPHPLETPSKETSCSFSAKEVQFGPGEVKRFFLAVPTGASLASVKLFAADKFTATAKNGDASAYSRRFMIQAVQVFPGKNRPSTKVSFYDKIAPGVELEKQISVEENCTLEICIAQNWSSSGRTILDKVEVIFGGLQLKSSMIAVPAGSTCSSRVEVTNLLTTDVPSPMPSLFEPKAAITHVQRPLAPTSATITPLSERDRLPEWRQLYNLVLTYTFSLNEAAEASVHFQGLSGLAYESELEGGPFHIVCDANKKVLLTGDWYPKVEKLPKGKNFVIRASLRHEKLSFLEDLRNLNALLRLKLPSEETLDCYSTQQGAMLQINDKKLRPKADEVAPGDSRSIFLSAPKKALVSKHAQLGDTLVGYLSVDKWPSMQGGRHSSGSRPNKKKSTKGSSPVPKHELNWGVSPPPSNGSSGSQSSSNSMQQAKKNSSEDNPQFKVQQLKLLLKERKLSDFDTTYQAALTEHPDHLGLLSIRLERLDECAAEEPDRSTEEVIAAADAVIDKVDKKEIACTFGFVVDTEDDEEVSARKEMEKQRAILCQALVRKVRAVRKQLETTSGTDESKYKAQAEVFGATVKELRKWFETSKVQGVSSEEVAIMSAERDRLRKRYGSSLRTIASIQDNGSMGKEAAVLRRKLYADLEWQHVMDYEDRWKMIKHPKSFPLF